MANTFLIAYDADVEDSTQIEQTIATNSADKHFKPFDGAVLITTPASKADILKRLVDKGFNQFLITPVDLPPLDGAIDRGDWADISQMMGKA